MIPTAIGLFDKGNSDGVEWCVYCQETVSVYKETTKFGKRTKLRIFCQKCRKLLRWEWQL